ncbi:MAG: hypothetical protein AB8G14_01385 [Ilumatobacter sp.]
MRWRSLLTCTALAAGLIAVSPPGPGAADANVADAAAANVSGPANVGGLVQPVRLERPQLVSTLTEVLQAGVVGINRLNDTFPTTDISVAAIAEVGNNIYVGGKFTQVEIAATGARIDQPFLAAFDRTTGAWIPSFRPVINGNVWDLTATDDGQLVVGGQFTSVNGAANTSGVAMLDPISGALNPTWRVNLTLTGIPRWPIARTLDIDNGWLYIGGNFTRINSADGQLVQTVQVARVELSSGNVDRSFIPHFDGIVFDIDADGDRVYVVGNFLFVNGVFSVGLGVLNTGDASSVSGLQPWVRTSLASTERSYQQAVLVLDDQVWQAGSQHSRQVYRRSDHALSRSWVSAPFGDGQALATNNGVMYSGSHANGASRLYQDAIHEGLTGTTSSRAIRWMAAFSTVGQQHLDWIPRIESENGEGSWELFVDSTDCLWTGGDFNRGTVVDGTARYVQGFAKFCP